MSESIWSGMRGARVCDGVDAGNFHDVVVSARRPAVLKGLVAQWPAVIEGTKSPAALCAYLRGQSSDKPVQAFFGRPEIAGRFFYSDDLKGFNHERKGVPLGALLDLLLEHLADGDPPSFYAGAVPIRECLPDLMASHAMPLLPPTTDMLVNIWIGNRTRIAAHWDLPQNIACVVSGRRRYTLFPIEQVSNLYPGPLDFTLAGQAVSLVDFFCPDYERFPRFREALAHAEVATLEPGDALYLPSLWWHHAASLDPFGMMINYWWRDGAAHMVTPLITLLHALLTVRDLPAAEREAWRKLFDYYIFQTNGDPAAHLPEEARGILGEMTPQKVSSLKAYLRKTLGGS